MAKLKTLAFAVAAAMTLPAWADQNLTADLVVVGAGAGGTIAAVEAVEGGLKTIMLEKNAFAGGAGNFMEGSFAAESFMQKEKGVKLTKTEAFNRMAAYHHWRVNAPLMKAFVDNSADMVQWVWDHGVHWKEVKTAWRNNDVLTWHIYPKAGALPSTMVKIFKEKGGQLLLSTPAEKLIVENGKVVGVEAKNGSGEKVTVRAKNVILATGGYNFNVPMVKEMTGIDMIPVGAPGRTGDGVQMLESAGAKLVNMNVCMQAGLWLKGVPTDLQFGKDGVTKAEYVRLLAALFQPYLKTSLQGERVADETLPLEYISNAFEKVGGEGFAVFDDKTREEMIKEGLPRGYFGMVTPGTKFTNFDALFERGVKDGFCYKADTLEDLAKMTGMDPARLAATANRMNELVKIGKDEDFYKDSEWLREVKTGPFYAIKGSLRTYATTGGASVNEYFQPLDEKGNVIKGIYAIGQDGGGLYSDSYDMHIAEGTASSWAICGGKLAVDHIVKTAK